MKKLRLFFAALLISACASQMESDEAARLRAHVVKLSVELSPRSHLDLENLNACADYIEAQLQATGARVSRQAFVVKGHTYWNVSALFGEADAPRWVVGAHYDAHVGTPGADDNASGVAGLLELAHRLGRLESPPAVELVAFCLEEPPFFGSTQMGSHVHAESLSTAGVEVRGMLALEMIGYFSDRRGRQHYPNPEMSARYPDRGNFIAVISRLDQADFTRRVYETISEGTDLPVEMLVAPEKLPGVDFSDHRNYWKFGYPAAMITDTAFMRNPEYHRPGDTHDRLDYLRMSKVVEGLFHLLTQQVEPGPACSRTRSWFQSE